jgi:hypothetical protein
MVTWKASLISGIKESQANKDRELAISEDLRNHTVVSDSEAHIAKLTNILGTATTMSEAMTMLRN